MIRYISVQYWPVLNSKKGDIVEYHPTKGIKLLDTYLIIVSKGKNKHISKTNNLFKIISKNKVMYV